LVGSKVGKVVGFAKGCLDGLDVGSIDGNDDGCELGKLVG
jgi:hypothetical protein